MAFANVWEFLPRVEPPRSLRVLDIGADPGALGVTLAIMAVYVTLPDSAPHMLSLASRAVPEAGVAANIALQRGDANRAEASQWCACRRAPTCNPGSIGPASAALAPDSYCPIVRGRRPALGIHRAANRHLPKLNSSCTTVVIARDGDELNLAPM